MYNAIDVIIDRIIEQLQTARYSNTRGYLDTRPYSDTDRLSSTRGYLDSSGSLDTDGYSYAYKYLDFSHVTKRRTGSVSSGVKVALPHETDYVLEISLLNTDVPGLARNMLMKQYTQELQKRLRMMVERQKDILLQHVSGWKIHGSYPHEHVPGVCLLMEYFG